MALYQSISGTVSTELIAVGKKKKIKELTVVGKTAAVVDLYIRGGATTTTYYLLKGMAVPAGVTLVLDSEFLNFNNNVGEYGLYIQLASGTVDILINEQ